MGKGRSASIRSEDGATCSSNSYRPTNNEYHLRGGHATIVNSGAAILETIDPAASRFSKHPLVRTNSQLSLISSATTFCVEDRRCWPKGLRNVGNTCYANAALQCLLSTALPQAILCPKASAIFRRYSSNSNLLEQGTGIVLMEDESEGDIVIRSSSHQAGEFAVVTRDLTALEQEAERKELEERKMYEKCQWLTHELKSITILYTDPTDPSSSPISLAEWLGMASPSGLVVDPGAITGRPDRLSNCLRPYQQEDAHEFLRALLGTLVMNGQNKELSSLFDGLLESSVTCQTCRRPSLTRDRYMDLSLDIHGQHIHTLTEALEEFTKAETLSGDNKVFCNRCNTKHTATKALRLATAPTILVCHLKRFAFNDYGHLVRLSKRVAFPTHLEIGSFMSKVNKARPPPYELVAVLVHQGISCDSGHYVAFVKSNGAWFKCNDSVVEKVDLEMVLKQQAYILMYEVENMREKHGYASPNKFVHPSSYGRSARSARHRRGGASSSDRKDFFSLTDMLCSVDTSFVTDVCCADAGFWSNQGKNKGSSSTRRGRRRRSSYYEQSRDDSTLESADSEGDRNVRFPMRRSKSSGSVRRRRYRHQHQRGMSFASPEQRPSTTLAASNRQHSFSPGVHSDAQTEANYENNATEERAAMRLHSFNGTATFAGVTSSSDPGTGADDDVETDLVDIPLHPASQQSIQSAIASGSNSSLGRNHPKNRDLPPRPSHVSRQGRVYSAGAVLQPQQQQQQLSPPAKAESFTFAT